MNNTKLREEIISKLQKMRPTAFLGDGVHEGFQVCDLLAAIAEAPSEAQPAPKAPETLPVLDHVECKACGTYFWCQRCDSYEPELHWKAAQADQPK